MPTSPSRSLIALSLLSLLSLAIPGVAFPKDVDRQPVVVEEPSPDAQPHTAAAFGDLPVSFELNVGQSDERVAFLSRASGARVFLTPDELVLALPRSAPAGAGKRAPDDLAREPLAPAVVRMRLAGASPSTPVGEDEIETKTNYFIGRDPSRWHTDVPNFARVRYPDVYPGVDLVLYGNHGTLEYDLVLAPGADPSVISVVWEGADSVEADASGALAMSVDGGQLLQHAPVLYQHSDAEWSSVAGRFVSRGDGRFGLDVGAYDHAKPLVVDPAITYSTFLGGSGTDIGEDIAVDATGAAYIVGYTYSSDFPTYLGYDSTINGSRDAFVTKLNKSGTALVYSTYLGGSSSDEAECGAIDAAGTVTVAGYTSSSDFPTTDGYDDTLNGWSDVFVARLGAQGNSLVAATYLGGSSSDYGEAIALDSRGNAYVASETESNDFPTTANAYDSALNGSSKDVTVTKLVLKLAPPPIYLSYSTYLGGGNWDFTCGIVVDSTGAAYVTGYTYSSDFPTLGGLDATYNGGGDSFVAKLSPQGDTLLNSTFLGGNALDAPLGIAMDAAGAVYITGTTESSNFPVTANSYDTTFNGPIGVVPTSGGDAFVAKLHVYTLGTFSALVLDYSTFIGGSGPDLAHDIALDSEGNVLITGYCWSAGFPLSNAVDSVSVGDSEAFVTKLNAAGDGLVYSTYLGGSRSDYGYAIAVDSKGSAYVTGLTESSDFPLVNAFDTTRVGQDAFVAKILK